MRSKKIEVELSIRQLADKLGVSRNTIAKYLALRGAPRSRKGRYRLRDVAAF